MGDITVLISKLISTFQLHIVNSKHYKLCKFSKITDLYYIKGTIQESSTEGPFPVTSSGSCTPAYLIFTNMVTKPRKSGYEYKARYHMRT